MRRVMLVVLVLVASCDAGAERSMVFREANQDSASCRDARAASGGRAQCRGVVASLGLREYPGYIGAFTRGQVPGAIPNGAAIVKIAVGTGDTYPIGTRGVVLGSIGHAPVNIFYFVEWNETPGVAFGCVGAKLREAR